jgi:pimeloyl-ACP methyl ester carboxylesterase
MSEGRLQVRDGRTIAWREYGPAGGRPVFRFQGTPGSRMGRFPHEEAYERLGVHIIAMDRPGYGASSRLPGHGISAVADDAAELLDHLGIDVVHAAGQSGGGPHVLAFAARHPERARAISVVVGSTPLEEEDTAGLIGLNRDGWYAARDGGWDALFKLLAPVRDELVADPLAAFRAVMEDAPASDQEVMNDPDYQRVLIEDIREALRPGAEGWTDESMALHGPPDFDPADVRCSVVWWHGEHDANVPLSAVHRVFDKIPSGDLRVWSAGHLESFHRHDEIMSELLAR